MILNRRNFLQKSALGLLTLGSLNNNISIDKYAQNLTQSTNKKLALLIGINQYPDRNLYGCLTDVELQKELLIYRFGFKPQDIISLTDNQATKENIENAFLNHFINQVKRDDIVLFHFSGFGRKINIQDSSNQLLTNINSIIPSDGILAKEKQLFANDIILDTFLNLGNSLATDKLTMVFDTSFDNNQVSISKNLSFRSYLQDNIVTIDQEKLIISNTLKKQLKSNFQLTLNNKKNLDSILFANKKGVANEIVSHNFNAGFFTYLLTQYLWELIPPNNIIFTLAEIYNQKSLLTSQFEDNISNLNVNNNVFSSILFDTKSSGQALVTEITKDNFVNLDLIGLPFFVLINYGINSIFTSKKAALNFHKISIISREGLRAKAIIIEGNSTINKGDIFRELIRVLPRKISLKIALSDQLARIEKVDATSSLSSINQINSIVNIGDDFPDCIIGKSLDQQNFLESYALFSPTGVLLSNTRGNIPNEAVSTAVTRFIPQLHILLAKKLLHLTLNQGSSLLPISVSFEVKKDNFQQVIKKETFASKIYRKIEQNDQNNLAKNSLFSSIPIGSQISLKITNYSATNIYFILFKINSFDKISAYLLTEDNPIESNQTMIISDDIEYLNSALNTNKNSAEFMLIVSSFPFTKILTKIDNHSDGEVVKIKSFLAIAKPIEFCLDILEDLHSNSQVNSNVINNVTDVYALDVNQWASFNFQVG